MAVMKSVNMLLLDGTPNGRIKYSLANWSGVAYRLRREQFLSCKDLMLFRHNFVYVLIGGNREEQTRIYVGYRSSRTAANNLKELRDSLDSEFNDWTTAVLIGRQSELSVSEVQWLVKLLATGIANGADYRLMNESWETSRLLQQEQYCELDEFFENVKLLLSLMGLTAFERVSERGGMSNIDYIVDPNEPTLVMYYLGVRAFGKKTSCGFLLMKGSRIRRGVTRTCPVKAVRQREQYASLVDARDYLTEDIHFTSPSAAATFVAGANISGIREWTYEENCTMEPQMVQGSLFE